MEKNNRKVNHVKTVGLMMIITLLGKILGLGRDLLTTYYYGLDGVGAAFATASLVPRKFLDIIFASAISASFIPIFNSYLVKKGEEEAFDLANHFISLIIVLASIVTIVGIVFANPIASVMNSAIEGEYLLLTVDLLKIMMPLIILSGVAFSLTGILQSLGEFNIPASMSLLSNIVIILYYFTFREKFDIYGLAVVFVIGWALQVVVQIPFLIKKKYKFRFKLSCKHEGVKEILVLMLPIMISTWSQPINVLVNTAFANSVDASWGAALSNADNLFTIITGVFILSVTNIIFPELSQEVALNNDDNFASIMSSTLRIISYLLLPMAVGLLVLSSPIVSILFERGATSKEQTMLITTSLRYYLFGILGIGIQTIASRGLYACKDGKTPLITGVIAIAINFICSYLLLDVFGVGGPALASSISMTVVAIVMILVLNNKYKGIFNKNTIVDILKMFVASVFMALPVYFVYLSLQKFSTNLIFEILIIFIAVLVGILAYFVSTWYFRIDETKKVMEIVKNILGKVK